jgi:sugar/nucleoside kinase (ribokinase family)
MHSEPAHHIARLDRQELADMPAHWTNQERGHFLRHLLHLKGIDANRFYRVEYYPHRTCWLLLQEAGSEGVALSPGKADDQFYAHLLAELRRTALASFAHASTHSAHFARFGCNYELPPKPLELSPAELANLLDAAGKHGDPVQFDSEGGWRAAAKN